MGKCLTRDLQQLSGEPAPDPPTNFPLGFKVKSLTKFSGAGQPCGGCPGTRVTRLRSLSALPLSGTLSECGAGGQGMPQPVSLYHLQSQLHSLGDSIFWKRRLHQGHQLAPQRAPLRANGVIVLAEPRHDHEVQGEVRGDDAADPLLLQLFQTPQLCKHAARCRQPWSC